MFHLNKRAVCVLFGGKSSEHEVSISSGVAVLNNIDYEKYDVYPVGITKEGKWRLCPKESIADFDSLEFEDLASVVLSEGKITVCPIDGERYSLNDPVIFSILHGTNGEDGRLQGMLELEGIKFVGCGCESSAICFDKAATKTVVSECKVRQARAKILFSNEIQTLSEDDLDKIAASLGGYPVFVKPARSGSSVGVTKVKRVEDFSSALNEAAREDRKILVEEAIVGDEAEVAVLELDGDLTVSLPAKIFPAAEFYSYDAKYNNSDSSYVIPAPYSSEVIERLRSYAADIFRALECRGLARVDFFVNGDDIVFNEINTLPGFTEISMYPKLMMYSGYSYAELISLLIDNA